MRESVPLSNAVEQKRRSTRVMKAVLITVTGVDALGQSFRESTTTVMVNCHGCKFKSKYYVPKNSLITVEIPRPGLLSPRILPARVIWVQRPRTFQDIVHIGVEFETPGNVWGLESPPEDWFPFPNEEEAETPADSKGNLEPVATPPSPESGIELVSSSVRLHEPNFAVSWHMSEIAAEAAVREELTPSLEGQDAEIYRAIPEAVKSSIERIAEAAVEKIAQQVAERTAAMVEEGLEAKIRQAVEEAMSAQGGRQRKKKQEGSKKKLPPRE